MTAVSRYPLPDYFIVGAPKSGTTALDAYLSQHPEIYVCYRKEMHFFGRDLTKEPHEFFVLDEDRYRWMFREARPGQRVGEASVHYLLSKTAAQEIRDFSPAARIIIMLRNPVDMLYSFHSQLLWGTYEDIPDFETALAAEPDRRAGRRLPRCAMMRQALYYREVASFAGQVERYFEVFGRDRVHVVLFDDFSTDPAGAYRNVLEFLDVSPHQLGDYRVVNANKTLRSRWLAERIQRPPRMVSRLSGLIPDKRRYWLYWLVSRLNSKIERRAPLTADLRARLLQEMAPEVGHLGELLGRDLSHWSQLPGT